jgi:hypothetical protein
MRCLAHIFLRGRLYKWTTAAAEAQGTVVIEQAQAAAPGFGASFTMARAVGTQEIGK